MYPRDDADLFLHFFSFLFSPCVSVLCQNGKSYHVFSHTYLITEKQVVSKFPSVRVHFDSVTHTVMLLISVTVTQQTYIYIHQALLK